MPLQGKVALITGAARRIGAEIARALHGAGACVVVHYGQSKADAESMMQELNETRQNSCFSYQADLGDVSALTGMVEDVVSLTGRLDILVNNASGFYPTPVGSITESAWTDLLASNLKGPLFLSQAAAPYLRKAKGCIVNMVDIHAERPLYGHSVYCAAKAGLVMVTKSLAQELGPQVRVNAVAPGIIIWPESAQSNHEQGELLGRTALKREGNVGDIAKAVLFLVQDAGYITGHVMAVDGGRTLFQ
ncbi:MAG: pteridine reductase [Proteobacteria bacterium]|nr:MAG: pteridine reductase [Pseudomonadota bacterium]